MRQRVAEYAGWAVVVVVAVLYAGALLALWPEPDYLKPPREAQTAQDKQADAKQPPATTEPKDQPPSAENEKDCANSQARSDCLIQLRTARATEAQARYAKWGLWLIGGTIFLTFGTVIAGFWTVSTMRDTGQRELRAYVAGIPTRLVELTPTTNPRLSFKITNHGATPAHRMNHAAALLIETHPLPENYPFPDVQVRNERPSVAVLHPESAVPYYGHFTRATPFTADEIIEIFRGHGPGKGRRLYAFAQIDYVDAFNRPRWTRFCASYTGRRGLADLAETDRWELVRDMLCDDSGESRWESTSQHNETDQD
jgi:hypothetical protein